MERLSINYCAMPSEQQHILLHKNQLLSKILNQLSSSAMIIFERRSNGYFLQWANDFALQVASSWDVYQFYDEQVVFSDAHLKCMTEHTQTSPLNEPTKRHFSKGQHFFDVNLYHLDNQCKNSSQLKAIVISGRQQRRHQEQSVREQLAPAEYMLTQALESEGSLKVSAKVLNISYENARTTLKHIYSKLNVHSQHELLLKIRQET